jgi:hypothetical protein
MNPMRAAAPARSIRAGRCVSHRPTWCQELSMMDVLMLALGLALFALSVGYVVACERL